MKKISICLFITLLLHFAAAGSRLEVRLSHLRCENRENPLGTDAANPRLSWWMEGDARGLRQTAYRILVSSDPDKLAKDMGDLWDSGRMTSDSSSAVRYKGMELKTGQPCFWKVMAWYTVEGKNRELMTGWSESSHWTCGKMKPEDWQGTWIGASEETDHGAVYLRKDITAAKTVKKAIVFFSGLGFSEFYIDGNKVGDYLIGPGFTNYNKRTQYLTFDVTEHFSEHGKKALGVILTDGWYGLGEEPWGHHFERNVYVDRPKLLLNLHIEYQDGSEEVFTSGPGWKWSGGEIVKSAIAYEDIDKRRSIEGWNLPGYDCSNWKDVKAVNGPEGRLVNQKEDFNRVIRTISPVGMKYDGSTGTCIFDLGEEVNGLITFKAAGERGTTLKITPLAGMADFPHTSRFILAGTGANETYIPSFFYHGMRKVKVEGLSGEPSPGDLEVRVISSVYEFPQSFSCSDDLVNWLNRSVQRTVQAYTTFLPNDPTREFKAWMEDPQNMFVSSVYLFNAQNMYERWQYDIIEGQREDGSAPNVTPGAFFDDYNSTWWGGCIVWLPWHWYMYYGDVSLLKESYPAMKKYVDYLSRIAVDGTHDWGLHDWQPVEETPRVLINTPAYYLYADITARTAALMGLGEDEKKYRELAEDIRNNYNRKFLDCTTGIYHVKGWQPKIIEYRGKTVTHEKWYPGDKTCTQAGQVLPIALGMVPAECIKASTDALLREIRAHGNRLSTGFVTTPYLLQVVAKADPEAGWEMTTAKDYPSWYSMTLGSGNDLMNEDWAGGNAFMPSLGGNISAWTYEALAGIKPDPANPGFKNVIIKPSVVGHLHWVNGWHDGPFGRIESRWRIVQDTLYMDVTIPPNSTGTVYIPLLGNDPGYVRRIKQGNLPAVKSKGVKLVGADKESVIFRASSGVYRFSVTILE
jgi:alpha-L-rhamnosidase